MSAKKKPYKSFDFHLLSEIGVPIVNVVADSRSIKPGDTFLAYAGETADGRKYIPQAIAAGANAILWDPHGFTWNPAWQIPALAIDELRSKVGQIASYIYGHPSQKLWVVGITGTNGKTSCSHWYAQAMANLGKKTAVVGTLGSGFCGALENIENTTPDAAVLQRLLAGFVAQGAEAVAMEVSSHGLVQGRINGTAVSVAVLTNLSRDHLDYHHDMGSYAAAKAELFFWPGLKYAIVNMDDVLGVELSRQLANKPTTTIGYGFHYPREQQRSEQLKLVYGYNLIFDRHGMAFDIEFEDNHAHLEIGILGKFNASNLLAVIAALLASGVQLPDAVRSLQQVQPIPGRMEKYEGIGQPTVIVDYAHTPDALEKVMCTLRELLRATQPQSSMKQPGRLLCVVGCGGDRDKGKRALVGEAATRLADEIIFTSDNPRSEEPIRVINEMIAGAKKSNYQVETDRSLAIYQAIANAQPDDIVLIAGKGHEKYQEIKGEKFPFSDAEVVQQVLNDLAAKVQVPS